MIKFEFSLEQDNLGHISILHNNSLFTSSESPLASMMVFIAIADLLEGIIDLIKTNKKEFVFVGADSSFIFTLKKNKDKGFTLTNDNNESILSSEPEIINSVWEALLKFLSVINTLEHNDPEFKDLSYMMEKYRKEFELEYK